MADKQPQVSPLSMSVWQDVSNPNQWNWSIHKLTHVQVKGRALDFNVACQQAREAMDKMVNKK